MPKHWFFDLDNTLTPSRRPLHPSHAPVFERLCGAADVIVVTGGTREHIEQQLGPSSGRYSVLAQSGNHAVDPAGTELWREQLSEQQVRASLELIGLMRERFALTVRDEGDLIDDRGAQIGFSVIGYHEDPAKKDAFDPDFSRRKQVLAELADDVARLGQAGIEVFPAGSSGYNFTMIGKDKGANVERFIRQKAWEKQECLYIGDALNPGENDYSVVGVIPTRAVTGPDDTFAFISSMLS